MDGGPFRLTCPGLPENPGQVQWSLDSSSGHLDLPRYLFHQHQRHPARPDVRFSFSPEAFSFAPESFSFAARVFSFRVGLFSFGVWLFSFAPAGIRCGCC